MNRIRKRLLIVMAVCVFFGMIGFGLQRAARAIRVSSSSAPPSSFNSRATSIAVESPALRQSVSPERLPDDDFVELAQPARVVRVPAEFEPQRAILVSGQHLVKGHLDTFASVVEATRGRSSVVALIGSDDERGQLEALLHDRGIVASHVLYVGLPHDSPWIRDFGPIVARRNDGSTVVIDAHYGESDRFNDDVVPTVLANCLRVPVVSPPIIVDGGNLLTNGDGVFVTTRHLIDQNDLESHNEDTIGKVLRAYYGANDLVVLLPLNGEPTGHVDVFATFCGPRTIVVGEYDPDVDPVNAEILDRNAAKLASVMTRDGPLKIVRVPMPSNVDGCWRTFTNVVYANGTLLMPSYIGVDRRDEEIALETFQTLLPAWHIVSIDAESLCSRGGALRCITANLGPIDRIPPCWDSKRFLAERGSLPSSFQWSDLCDYHRDGLHRLRQSRRSFSSENSNPTGPKVRYTNGLAR